jgi:hypothetical protein
MLVQMHRSRAIDRTKISNPHAFGAQATRTDVVRRNVQRLLDAPSLGFLWRTSVHRCALLPPLHCAASCDQPLVGMS